MYFNVCILFVHNSSQPLLFKTKDYNFDFPAVVKSMLLVTPGSGLGHVDVSYTWLLDQWSKSMALKIMSSFHLYHPRSRICHKMGKFPSLQTFGIQCNPCSSVISTESILL